MHPVVMVAGKSEIARAVTHIGFPVLSWTCQWDSYTLPLPRLHHIGPGVACTSDTARPAAPVAPLCFRSLHLTILSFGLTYRDATTPTAPRLQKKKRKELCREREQQQERVLALRVAVLARAGGRPCTADPSRGRAVRTQCDCVPRTPVGPRAGIIQFAALTAERRLSGGHFAVLFAAVPQSRFTEGLCSLKLERAYGTAGSGPIVKDGRWVAVAPCGYAAPNTVRGGE